MRLRVVPGGLGLRLNLPKPGPPGPTFENFQWFVA
jgi:hypothetical protein